MSEDMSKPVTEIVDDGALGSGNVITIEEPEDKVPAEPATPEPAKDKEPEGEVKEKQWDKERQYKDEMMAERRKREEAEAKLQQAIADQGNQMASAIEKLAQTMQSNTPKEDPRAKLIEKMESLNPSDDPDEQAEYLRKSKELMKELASLQPEKVEVAKSDPKVLETIEAMNAELQTLRTELSLSQSTSRTSAWLDELDSQYDRKYRADAIQAVAELTKLMPDDTPDDVIKQLYEKEYRLAAAAEPPQRQSTTAPPVLDGKGGVPVAGSPPPDGLSSIDDAKARLMARLPK